MSVQKTVKIALLLLLGAAIIWGIMHRDQFSVEQLRQQFESLGVWAPLAYILLYVLATVLFLPGSVLTLVGGLVFGPVWGTLYTLVAATLGATLAFLIARYVASDWVASKAGGRMGRIITGVEKEGWRFVAFTRLVPVFPYNLLNYALGLTKIPLPHYVLASLVCMAPATFAYTYVGYAGGQAVSGGLGADTVRTIAIAVSVFVAVMFIPSLIKRMRKEGVVNVPDEVLEEKKEEERPQ